MASSVDASCHGCWLDRGVSGSRCGKRRRRSRYEWRTSMSMGTVSAQREVGRRLWWSMSQHKLSRAGEGIASAKVCESFHPEDLEQLCQRGENVECMALRLLCTSVYGRQPRGGGGGYSMYRQYQSSFSLLLLSINSVAITPPPSQSQQSQQSRHRPSFDRLGHSRSQGGG